MLYARIARPSGVPISLAEWKHVIATHPALEPIPDRVGINPFTQEKVVFPGEGAAFYVVNGERAGNAALEDGQILTTGLPPSVCEAIAGGLGAEVFEDDRS